MNLLRESYCQTPNMETQNNHHVFIIAEIGINHNGDINTAKELIKEAKYAGCDAVKFQKRTIDTVYSKELLDSPRESPWGTTQRHQKEALEFGQKEYEQIDEHCHRLDIDWFASAWDLDSQEFLKQFNLRHNKVASPMLVHTDLLKAIASEGKRTFISTGMSTVEQIDQAVVIFQKNNCPFVLMHCKSTYPLEDVDANLRCILTLRKRYQCEVGYSGHEDGIAISYAAVALGAIALERHITLDRSMYGSDQAASLGTSGLRQLVGGVRKIEKAMGDGAISVSPKEVPIQQKLRSHILHAE